MTANEFRKPAPSFPEASENAHMGHPDFRVGGKIFATVVLRCSRGSHNSIAPLDPPLSKAIVRVMADCRSSFSYRPTASEPLTEVWGRKPRRPEIGMRAPVPNRSNAERSLPAAAGRGGRTHVPFPGAVFGGLLRYETNPSKDAKSKRSGDPPWWTNPTWTPKSSHVK